MDEAEYTDISPMLAYMYNNPGNIARPSSKVAQQYEPRASFTTLQVDRETHVSRGANSYHWSMIFRGEANTLNHNAWASFNNHSRNLAPLIIYSPARDGNHCHGNKIKRQHIIKRSQTKASR